MFKFGSCHDPAPDASKKGNVTIYYQRLSCPQNAIITIELLKCRPGTRQQTEKIGSYLPGLEVPGGGRRGW